MGVEGEQLAGLAVHEGQEHVAAAQHGQLHGLLEQPLAPLVERHLLGSLKLTERRRVSSIGFIRIFFLPMAGHSLLFLVALFIELSTYQLHSLTHSLTSTRINFTLSLPHSLPFSTASQVFAIINLFRLSKHLEAILSHFSILTLSDNNPKI